MIFDLFFDKIVNDDDDDVSDDDELVPLNVIPQLLLLRPFVCKLLIRSFSLKLIL